MKFKCHKCSEDICEHERVCVVCGADAGFPNVRAALQPDEVNALEIRVKKAVENARSQGCESILDKFREVVSRSSAIVCCSLSKLSELLSSDNQLYQTFYQAIGSEARLPEDNEYDNIRGAIDSLIFPHYNEHIRFGALSVDRSGVSGYGGYSMVLREATIGDRATVFEENTISFVQNKRIVAGDPLPLGYRSTWGNRDMLAAAKLGIKITATTSEDDFPEILLSSRDKNSDFIEVHIYGPIHRRAIEHISGPEPRPKADKVLFRSVQRKIKEIGATVELVK